MHIERRKQGGKTKYYLAHSYRKSGKVRKIRVFLGTDLSDAELEARRGLAEAKLKARARESRRIPDPYTGVLSDGELAELKSLEAKASINISHLSDDDWRKFTEAFTYDTNAIEGSTVDAKEVACLLGGGKWPNRSKEEISETYGVAKAIDFIRKTEDHLSLPLILELHRIVFENSKPFAGKLRGKGVEVAVADGQGKIIHRGAPSGKVRSLLARLAAWYYENVEKYPPLVLAAVVHNQFETVHPFQDGNGRVGRLLMNNILLKHGMPPISIELRDRKEYYAALQAYEEDSNLRPTIELMLKECRSLKRLMGKRR